MNAVRRYLSSFVDVRKGEALLTLLMFLYYYLILVTYYLLKPARDSLFLVKLGSSQLPLVFILTALVIAPITTFYARASRSLKLTHLVYVTFGILIVNLVVLRWLLDIDATWVFYLFYVWVSIYGALTASQYWLFANAVYDPAQGKRLFALLNVGGIVGAMTGGEVTGLVVKWFGVATEDLLYFCIVFIAIIMVLVNLAWRTVLRRRSEGEGQKRASKKEDRGESVRQIFGMIKRSRHLMLLVGIIALTMATASFVDYQFKTVSVQSFPAKEDLTSFLGTFYGRLSLVSVILQLLFTYRLLRVLGVGGVVAVLPVALLVSSATMFAVPGLFAAVMLRGTDGAFKYSLDKTGRELLFLPIPLEVKKRTKVFIDMFVDRWFRGVAGGALLLFTTVLGFSVRQLSVVVIGLLAVWITLVFLIRKEYVEAFRHALSRREIDPGQLTVNVSDLSTVNTLREALASGNDREVVYALDLLATTRDESLAADLEPLLDHGSREVRMKALVVFRSIGVKTVGERASELVRDADPSVRFMAMGFVVESSDNGDLQRYLSDDDPRVAATAVRYAAESGDGKRLAGSVETAALLERCASGQGRDVEVRTEVARALGFIAGEEHHKLLEKLLDDESIEVAGAAIVSAGRTKERGFVPTLVERLADRRQRKYAREALAAYGDGVVGTLSDHLADERVPVGVRRTIPQVLKRIPTQQSVDVLTRHLSDADASLRFRIIKALNAMRRDYPDLRIPEDRVDAAFVEEARLYYEILQIASVYRNANAGEPERLLERALKERLDLKLERIFRLLGLCYPPKDIYNAYLGVVSKKKDQRASAVEFLDNVVGKMQKRYLLPIIDAESESAVIRRGQEIFGNQIADRAQALGMLLAGSDPWLKACAVYCVKGEDSDQLWNAVETAKHDWDPVVAETAGLVLSRR